MNEENVFTLQNFKELPENILGLFGYEADELATMFPKGTTVLLKQTTIGNSSEPQVVLESATGKAMMSGRRFKQAVTVDTAVTDNAAAIAMKITGEPTAFVGEIMAVRRKPAREAIAPDGTTLADKLTALQGTFREATANDPNPGNQYRTLVWQPLQQWAKATLPQFDWVKAKPFTVPGTLVEVA
jgi:hypothetical protein